MKQCAFEQIDFSLLTAPFFNIEVRAIAFSRYLVSIGFTFVLMSFERV